MTGTAGTFYPIERAREIVRELNQEEKRTIYADPHEGPWTYEVAERAGDRAQILCRDSDGFPLGFM